MTLIRREDAIEAIPDTTADMFENCRNCKLLDKEQVIDILSALPSAETEWIPCSERLPSVDVEVLTTTDWSDVLIAWLNKDDAWETEEHILNNDEILAWMPLPKPYREGGKE